MPWGEGSIVDGLCHWEGKWLQKAWIMCALFAGGAASLRCTCFAILLLHSFATLCRHVAQLSRAY